MRPTAYQNGATPQTRLSQPALLHKPDQDLPVIALTATATPKVQEDILKNLQITDAKVFKASFNVPICTMRFVLKPIRLKLIS